MKYYVVHPGTVTLLDGTTDTLDAGTLASRYGLSAGDYDIDTSVQQDSMNGGIIQVHLYPRTDGRYQNIKTLLADNGTDIYMDKPVNWRKHQKERRKYL